ncbi:MAG: alpha-helical pore-forming toxin family protein [Chloroflexi bacterium]|nr:alpha-helical pore-forming toxin family protein [Chloroflexota bacterium]
MNKTILAAQQIDKANKVQTSQAMLIQQYANSIKEQPKVDFSGFKTLGKFETGINTGLGTAQAHADNYLNAIQPNIIINITNIGNYYALHNAVASTLPPGSTEQAWVATLSALMEQSQTYQSDAKAVVGSLQSLHNDLTSDSAAFSQTVSQLNAAVKGDNGVLASISDQLSTIQSDIDGAIAGIVLSGLAIIGGVFMTAVGAIAEFVTAGTSTALVLGGLAVTAAGIGGEVASAITLKNLNDSKATLLKQKSTLNAEVNLAQGISSSYQSLGNQVKTAVDAATAMENAWNFLSGDLGSLVNDLNQGIQNTNQVRTLFLTAANSEVSAVTKDISTIKAQMAGVQKVNVPKGTTVGDAIVAAAHGAAGRQLAHA